MRASWRRTPGQSTSSDLAGVFYESVHILLRELDLREEAKHTKRFARTFADHPQVRGC